MGSHPINLMLRFLLELASLIIMGIWGWNQTENWYSVVLAIGIPMIAATVWGIFAVPKDPSRSGKAPYPVAGSVRLIIEFLFFTFAAWALYDIGKSTLSLIFGFLVIGHYVLSYDRLSWLMNQKKEL